MNDPFLDRLGRGCWVRQCTIPQDALAEIERLKREVDEREKLIVDNACLRAALADAENELRKLKQKHCPYAPHRGDWCSCGWSRPTDTSNA